jgi:eukaryotic-like serine/threonine-protein kinase
MESERRENGRREDSFVDRLWELQKLRAGAEQAAAGRGQLFSIAGEPGIGKSRLADEAAKYAVAHGAEALWGRCSEDGGAPAYWPWIQIFRGLVNHADTATVSKWLGAGAAEIGQIVPELRDLLPNMPRPSAGSLGTSEQARFRLFDSAVSFLHRAAEQQVRIIVLDDLHAADTASLMMLLALSKNVHVMRVLVIGTYRQAEVRQSPERAALIAEAEREGAVLSLRGLRGSEIGEFIERSAGIVPSTSLILLLGEKTDGNPFFLSEILRLMAAEGRFVSGGLAAPGQIRIPDGVRESIKRRMAPLSDAARELLSIAAVIGREFDIGCLERCGGISCQAIVELLDQAVALELLSEIAETPGRYSFRHALIREAIYDDLPSPRRRTLHSLVGNAIRDTYTAELHSAELAYHYCEAAPIGDAAVAVEYSRRAAREAERQLAFEQASRHLSRALEVLPLVRDKSELPLAELLFELGQSQIRAGELAQGRQVCLRAAEIARRAGQTELFARAIVAAGRPMSNSGTTDRVLVALLREALQSLGDADSTVRAQVLARLGLELYWSEREGGAALCQQAVNMAKRVEDPHTSIIALWARHLSLRRPDALEQRLADSADLITIAEQAGERDFALEARFYRVADLLELGDIAQADIEQHEYLKAEAELRDCFKRGLLLEGMRALLDGRLDEAETLAQQALTVGQQTQRPLTLNSFLIQKGNILWERGRLGELEATLKSFIAQNPLIVFARCAWLLSLVQQGHQAEAQDGLDSLANDHFSVIPRDWNWLPSMFVLADACADLGAIDYASNLYELLVPYHSRNAVIGYVFCYGSVSYALGKLAAAMGALDKAEMHFATALTANGRLRAAVWVAHTQCELSILLLKRGRGNDRTRALELFAAASRTAKRLELVRLQHKLDLVKTTGLTGIDKSSSPPVSVQHSAPDLHGFTVEGQRSSVDVVAAAAISEPRDLRLYATLGGTLTILFSDIEDSSVIFEKLGDLRAQEIVRRHNQIVREQVSIHHGFEVKSTGDGFMVVFSSARRALLCAIAIQRAFASYSEEHAEQPIRVRIGLHVGEAIKESADFFGKAVILAARIAALAVGGEILVSATLRELADSAGDIRFVDAREVQLKGFSGTHRIYRVLW